MYMYGQYLAIVKNFYIGIFISLQIACCSLWNIRLVVVAKPEHKHRISHVQQGTVKTGIANALGMFPFGKLLLH